MTNSIDLFAELSDEQLADITGAGGGITIAPQTIVSVNVGLNVVNAPTVGVVAGVGSGLNLNLKGAISNLGNQGLLGNTNTFK